jgi:hypothetical protein
MKISHLQCKVVRGQQQSLGQPRGKQSLGSLRLCYLLLHERQEHGLLRSHQLTNHVLFPLRAGQPLRRIPEEEIIVAYD